MFNRGFTLIELMIVVAIIGILSMITVPAYQDYIKRTYVAEGIALASSVKTAVFEFYVTNGRWPESHEMNFSNLKSTAVKSIVFDSRLVEIRIDYNYKVIISGGGDPAYTPLIIGLKSYIAGRNKHGGYMRVLDPSVGSIEWICYSVAGTKPAPTSGKEALLAKWLPPNCREQIATIRQN